MDESPQDRMPRPASPRLLAVMGAVVLLQALAWGSGVRGRGLAEAVERGAARVEARSVGEVAEADTRRAIDDQRATLRFWAVLSAVGDFVVEPIAPALRAVLAASGFAAVAALRGRPVRFEEVLGAAASAQWLWVVGLGARVGLMAATGRAEVETSAALLLPPGAYPAAAWVALRQVDPFVILGWIAVGRAGWRLGLVGWGAAASICLVLWAAESSIRIGVASAFGAAMRATLLPG
ncbi:hypothetical protein [Tautonia plasticadhaerens]|uniref:Yip1 domain protein n=1 Tax=Tautonia plasticadhaerens TaxID=2527974 RepID=A0A518H5E5_9BACT|nr:hypothetical protein [Tautonia plasticadhaerens]QDV36067.1 hypothetical protein ElP_39770 [Tautonia plasticadhaerens]